MNERPKCWGELTGGFCREWLGKLPLPKNSEIASQGTSLLFKRIALRRIIDMPNRSIIYLSYGREIKGASAKIDMSTVPFGEAASAVVAPAAAAGR